MYETLHTDGKTKGRINLRSGVKTSPALNVGRKSSSQTRHWISRTRSREVFPCPKCRADLTKDNLQRVMETLGDPRPPIPGERVKFTSVLINYSVGGKKYDKTPDKYDQETLARIARMPLPASVPTDAFPIEQMYHGLRSCA